MPLRILITGATGFIGSALTYSFEKKGYFVTKVTRRPPSAPNEIYWNPAQGSLKLPPNFAADVAIHLAGSNIAERRWTPSQKATILKSRVESAKIFWRAVANLATPPKLALSASAVGFYGDRGESELGEESSPGQGFLSEVCSKWEEQLNIATARTSWRGCALRFGVVLGTGGGALARMLPLFRLGLGGPLGSGRQWMSWIHLSDLLNSLHFIIEQPALSGPINIVSPLPVRNAELSAELAALLRRPAFLRVPATVLRTVLGKMADEVLLSSTKALPRKLLKHGFIFQNADIRDALAASLPRFSLAQ